MTPNSGTAEGPGRGEGGSYGGTAPIAQLEAVFQHLPTAVVVIEAGSNRILLQNERLAAIWRLPLPALFAQEDLSEWHGFHADGRALAPEEWPPARTAATGKPIEAEELEILRGDGSRGVVRVCSTPVHDDHGRVVAAAATIMDVTEQRSLERSRRFLAEASAELVSSLSYGTTLRNVARLAVPELADWCAVDILGESGRVDRVAVEYDPCAHDDVGR